MLEKSLVVRIVAREGREEEVAAFLASARPLAEAEAGTAAWFAVRADASTFYIFDAFPGEAERKAHLEGEIARALLGRAAELLAEPPDIQPADVLAAKLA